MSVEGGGYNRAFLRNASILDNHLESFLRQLCGTPVSEHDGRSIFHLKEGYSIERGLP